MLYAHINGEKHLEKTIYPLMFRKLIRTMNNTCVVNAKGLDILKINAMCTRIVAMRGVNFLELESSLKTESFW